MSKDSDVIRTQATLYKAKSVQYGTVIWVLAPRAGVEASIPIPQECLVDQERAKPVADFRWLALVF